MNPRSLHDGRDDGLVPLESLALDDVTSFAELVRAMSKTAFGGRQLGEAFEILVEMAGRPHCDMILTLSGAMTVAKQGRIVCDMIDRGLVRAIIATGALIAHGVTESIGLVHYRHDPSKSDETLYQWGYNRIYDTLEMEANLNDVEAVVRSVLNLVQPESDTWSSAQFCRALGQRLDQLNHGPGILRSAYQRQVPIFIPAFTDSEMGLDMAIWAMETAWHEDARDRASLGANEVFEPVPRYNPFLDLQEYTRLVCQSEELGILTIGGGVPRNWAQQVGPFVDVTNGQLGTRLAVPRFRYGVRICPEPVHWGGLSGCTYSEGVSWGKFVPPSQGGRYAEVYADATTVLPLLMKAVFEELDRRQA